MPVFMFCAPGLFLGGTDGAGFRFQVLLSRTRFRRYRGRRVPISFLALPDYFWTVPRAPGPVFMFYAFGLVSGGTKGVRSRFHVLPSWTRFRRYQGRRVPFSCFARPEPFSAVPRALVPYFMFFAPGHVFGGTEVAENRFHVLHSKTRFGRFRGRRCSFLCFALPDSLWAVPTVPSFVFKFCAPGHVLGCTEGVGSRFHVLRSQTLLGWYRGRRVPILCFALLDSFWAILRASGTVFIFCALGLVFDGTEGVGSRFHVLRSLTRFRRYRGCRVPFLSFGLSDSFWAVPAASSPVFMFCAIGIVWGRTKGGGSCFQVLRSRTRFRRYRGRRVPFSCFALPDLFLTVPRPSMLDFMFWHYRGRRVPFVSFAFPDLFSTVPRASRLIFMFCSPGLFLGGTEAVGARFHVLHSRTRFGRYRGRRN
jgi:hypothetical protein